MDRSLVRTTVDYVNGSFPAMVQNMDVVESSPAPSGTAVIVNDLTFSYSGGKRVLDGINMRLNKGDRCLLVGANGTGKSTLLRCLAGKHLTKCVTSLGVDAFTQTPKGLRYLGTEWCNNPIIRTDMEVTRLIHSNGGLEYPERVRELLAILDIDPTWRMHQVSDGQRRRVQMLLGLLEPWDLLLMDEVTTDLDVIVRHDLLVYLKKECETRQATIVYATHIFDGIGNWPTHLCHLSFGKIERMNTMDHFAPQLRKFQENALEAESAKTNIIGNSPLLSLVDQWLRQDLIHARAKGKQAKVLDRVELRDKAGKDGDRFYNYWNRF